MLSERIKELREVNKYTQINLANKLGVTRSAVKSWEMGISIPSTRYIVELSCIFNVSTDYLLKNCNETTINISDLTEGQTEILYSLIGEFSFLNNKK